MIQMDKNKLRSLMQILSDWFWKNVDGTLNFGTSYFR